MTSKIIQLIFIVAILSMIGIYINTDTTCQINISGSIQVLSKISKDIHPTLLNQKRPISGAKVRIEKKRCNLCRWKVIEDLTTNQNGSFSANSILTGNSCNKNYDLRAKVKFENNDLEVRKGGLIDELGMSPKWYLVGELKKEDCHIEKDCKFSEMTFGGSTNFTLGNNVPKTHADIWSHYNWAIETMNDIGLPISPDGEKIKVVYPLNRLIVPDSFEGSYVNPSNKVIHIHKNHSRFDIALHELGHLWAFNYTTGEEIMKNYLFTKFSTHDLVNNPAVAFHEGFADYWMMMLKNIHLHNMGLETSQPEIHLKKYLHEKKNIQSNTFEKCEHHAISSKRKDDKGRLECHEKGWLNIFLLLSLDDFALPGSNSSEEIFTYNLYVGQNPNGQFVTKLNNGVDTFNSNDINCREFPLKTSFSEMLSLVTNIDKSDMNLDDFMNLYTSKLSKDPSDIELFKNVIDPTNRENMSKYYCKNAVVVTRLYFSEDAPRQVTWSEYGDHYLSDEPLKIEVKNMGTIATPSNIYLDTPINFVHDSTVSSLYKKRISIPVVGSSLNPGQSSTIEQYIFIPKSLTSLTNTTKLEYGTVVVPSKRDSITKFSQSNLKWKTNKLNIVLSPSLEASITTASPTKTAFRLKKINNNNKIETKCVVTNKGNAPMNSGTEVQIKLNDVVQKTYYLDILFPSESQALFYQMSIKGKKRQMKHKVECLVKHKYKKTGINETHFFHAKSSKLIEFK